MDNESMIIRVSGKLGEKIHRTPDEKIPMHENPYLDWSAHLFRAPRKEYMLVTNTASLYSILFPGRGVTDENEFLKTVARQLDEILGEDGFQSIYETIIEPKIEEPHFSKALNRSVIGSMNDLVKHAEIHLTKQDLSPLKAAQKLNDIPFSYLDYQKPKEAFRELQDG